MKLKITKSNQILFFVLLAVAFLTASGLTALAATQKLQGSQNLFTPATIHGSLAPSQDQTTPRYVDVNFALLDNALEGDAIGLNLYDDLIYTAILERKEPVQPDGYAWVGYLQGVEYSQVILVVSGGQMAGNITSPLGQYQVRYAGNGVHAIYTIDQSSFPDELPPIPVKADFGAGPNLPTVADLCTSIDVMVVWTQNAENAAGGATAMQNLVNLAVTETNQSYVNSQMTQRINLAWSQKVAYTESGDFATDLNRLTNPSDGYIDNVHTLRNTYYADLVSMFIEGTQYCGIGWMMESVSTAFAPNAFTVVARNCATGYFSFAHEMGHNEGTRHDWYVDSGNTTLPYAYAHGYVYQPGLWRTIMAYNNACSPSNCTRLQYWSNPSLNYNGIPMGVSGGSTPADNHRTLNNTCSTVANFRDRPAPGAFNKTNPSNSSTGVSTNPTLSWGSSNAATSYVYCYDTSNNSTCNTSWVSTGMNTSVGLSGLSAGTTYYWHVHATNAEGTTYSNSNTWWSFTTQVPAPGAFNKTSPSSGATGVSTSPTLSWGSSSGAASYEYCYDTMNNSACDASWTSVGGNTSVGLSSLSLGTIYYWQVRAVNGSGTTYADSNTWWSFTVQSSLQMFVYLPYINTSTGCTPLYSDDFSNSASGWPVGSTANVDYGYLSGEYRMYMKVASVGFFVRPGFQIDNFAASVVVRNVTNLDGSYGLMFGLSADWSQYYTFEIYADGWYEIWRYANSWTLLASSSSGYINTGTASNKLGIERNGSTINAYANGHLIANVTDSTFTGTRYLGLTASAYSQANQDIRFDNFIVNPVSCGVPDAASGIPAQPNFTTGNKTGFLPNYITLPATRTK